MLVGDEVTEPFTTAQLASLERTLADAQQRTGLEFAVYVGQLEAGRGSAVDIAREMPDPDNSVLVAVDPAERTLEIVTGHQAKERIDDQTCELASLTMSSRFAIGDLVAGLRDGVTQLADHANGPR